MIELFLSHRRLIARNLVVLTACLCVSMPALADGTARAIAGDVIELANKRYCLHGIDAPDHGQHCTLKTGKPYDCGRIATTALMDLLAGASVRCRPTGVKRTECAVARCIADGYDISGNMVYTGWALADPVDGDFYVRRQEQARSRGHGLWRGTFETPWEWRRKSKRQN
jgi:endonuclease YncB( thermonuclease family)